MSAQHEATVIFGEVGKVRVRFDYEPGRPCCMYLSNGDPGYPEEPETLTINEVEICGVWVNASGFSDEELEPVEQELLETHGKSLAENANEEAWDRQQERRMEEGYP